MPKKAENTVVEIKPLNMQRVLVTVVGETELIVHAWSEKAKRQMLDKQMGKAKVRKEPKDPQADYESSMYRFPDGRYGFRSSAFKAAIVGACRLFDGLPMTRAKVAVFVEGEKVGNETLVEIQSEPHMREDMVRLETGVADIRYRAGFFPWKVTLPITFNAGLISLEQLYNLVDAAGYGGVGEWRASAPNSCTGDFGRFKVERQ